jgi:hypothetical protein
VKRLLEQNPCSGEASQWPGLWRASPEVCLVVTTSHDGAGHAGLGVINVLVHEWCFSVQYFDVQGFGPGLFFILFFSLSRWVFGVVYWV